jgi:glucosamine--fructose-6-phosphate aminotransferase (isomerizing)
VHNGIIENHLELKAMLESAGKTFYSDTDTEVVAQLISYHYQGDFLEAVRTAFSKLKGSWGIALIHRDHPDQIIAAAKENPIVVGINSRTSEAFVSSDVNALQDPELEIVFLGDEEIALITPGQVTVMGKEAGPIAKLAQRLDLENACVSKNGYPHFMLKEIFEQPETLHQTFHNRLDRLDELTLSPAYLKGIERIVILACGTSWHSGQIAASFLEQYTHLPVHTEIASEFRYRSPVLSDKTLVIAISQSGETLDTLGAVREAKRRGTQILGICNVRNSTLTREAHCTLFLEAGKEVSVCSTKAFTSQVTLLLLFTLHLATLRGAAPTPLLKEIGSLPRKVQQVLHLQPAIQALAKKYAFYNQMFFLGRHYMYPTSLEAALKLKEISYIHAQAYPAGEMKHGPIALVDANLPVVGFCGNSHTLEKMLSNLAEIKARRAPLILFAPEGCPSLEKLSTDLISLPPISDELAPILYAVAGQLFAYNVAIERGTDIDQPRNLAKSVTVE